MSKPTRTTIDRATDLLDDAAARETVGGTVADMLVACSWLVEIVTQQQAMIERLESRISQLEATK